MYSRISIRNFRGIESLDASGFRRINLIMGRNNSGKTTLLESLLLLGGATNPHFATTLGPLRGQRFDKGHPDSTWRPLFHDLNPIMPVEIKGYWEDQDREVELRIEARESPIPIELVGPSLESVGIVAATMRSSVVGALRLLSKDSVGNLITAEATLDPDSGTIRWSGSFRSAHARTSLLPARSYVNQVRDAQQFSSILKNKHDVDVVDALRIIDPRVNRIDVLSEPSGPAIYLDIGLDTLVPLAVCGEGMVRLFLIILELVASRDGVLLIDEIDDGLHYSVMPKLWKLLGELVEKHDVQIFGTTHNDDVIRSALEAFVDKERTLGLFRIDKRGDRHVMVGYSEEAMRGILEDHFEVRG
jgi:hypothetical protein